MEMVRPDVIADKLLTQVMKLGRNVEIAEEKMLSGDHPLTYHRDLLRVAERCKRIHTLTSQIEGEVINGLPLFLQIALHLDRSPELCDHAGHRLEYVCWDEQGFLTLARNGVMQSHIVPTRITNLGFYAHEHEEAADTAKPYYYV